MFSFPGGTCGSGELESAITCLTSLQADLDDMKQAAASGQLRPLPGETEETCAHQLGHTSKTVGSSMAGLLTAAAQVTSMQRS